MSFNRRVNYSTGTLNWKSNWWGSSDRHVAIDNWNIFWNGNVCSARGAMELHGFAIFVSPARLKWRMRGECLIIHAECISALDQYNSYGTRAIQVCPGAWQLIKNQFTGLRLMPVTHRNQSICMQMHWRHSERALRRPYFETFLSQRILDHARIN